MASKGRNTVYRQYIRQALWGMCVDGVGDFNADDVAKYCGLTVTGNLRKQLYACVRDGILYYDFSGDRNIKRGIRFSFCNDWCNLAEAARS